MIYLILLVFLSYFHGKSALCPPSSIAVPSQNLCVALLKKTTVEGKNINVAWVGIISNPVTGKDLFLNGTDATNDLPLPLFWVNTKNATAYSDAWESCWFSLPNSTDCEWVFGND
ncbi:unnamed protein product, partial [Mesorhabditis belari]|uniref:Uncharacterized protein n=1 Tax=Mesorhabditis belari TaxID=2138241 RepID=A0AAF3J4B0_9BILA